jgi:hypothetical protein
MVGGKIPPPRQARQDGRVKGASRRVNLSEQLASNFCNEEKLYLFLGRITVLYACSRLDRGGFGPPKLSILLLAKCSRERVSSCALPA